MLAVPSFEHYPISPLLNRAIYSLSPSSFRHAEIFRGARREVLGLGRRVRRTAAAGAPEGRAREEEAKLTETSPRPRAVLDGEETSKMALMPDEYTGFICACVYL